MLNIRAIPALELKSHLAFVYRLPRAPDTHGITNGDSSHTCARRDLQEIKTRAHGHAAHARTCRCTSFKLSAAQPSLIDRSPIRRRSGAGRAREPPIDCCTMALCSTPASRLASTRSSRPIVLQAAAVRVGDILADGVDVRLRAADAGDGHVQPAGVDGARHDQQHGDADEARAMRAQHRRGRRSDRRAMQICVDGAACVIHASRRPRGTTHIQFSKRATKEAPGCRATSRRRMRRCGERMCRGATVCDAGVARRLAAWARAKRRAERRKLTTPPGRARREGGTMAGRASDAGVPVDGVFASPTTATPFRRAPRRRRLGVARRCCLAARPADGESLASRVRA